MLHPLTQIILAIGFVAAVVGTPLEEGLAVLLFGLGATLAVPSRTESRLVRPFLSVLGIAALFLLLLHGIQWHPPEITRAGLSEGLDRFLNIAGPVVAVLYLSRRIRPEELFVLLLDLRVPPTVVLIFFRTLWLVPRFTARMDETLIALRLRGMPVDSPLQRIRALAPSLGTIFASLFSEITDNSLVIAVRGFLHPGPKTHRLVLPFGVRDGAVIALVLLMMGILWF